MNVHPESVYPFGVNEHDVSYEHDAFDVEPPTFDDAPLGLFELNTTEYEFLVNCGCNSTALVFFHTPLEYAADQYPVAATLFPLALYTCVPPDVAVYHPVNVYPVLLAVPIELLFVESYVIVLDVSPEYVTPLGIVNVNAYVFAVQFAVNVGVAPLVDAKLVKYVPLFLFAHAVAGLLVVPYLAVDVFPFVNVHPSNVYPVHVGFTLFITVVSNVASTFE